MHVVISGINSKKLQKQMSQHLLHRFENTACICNPGKNSQPISEKSKYSCTGKAKGSYLDGDSGSFRMIVVHHDVVTENDDVVVYRLIHALRAPPRNA